MIRCPHCHRLVQPNNKFCPYCGTPLQSTANNFNNPNFNTQPNSPIPPRQYPHKKHHYIIGTLAIIVLLALGAGGAYMFMSNNNSSSQQSSSKVSSNNKSNNQSNDNNSNATVPHNTHHGSSTIPNNNSKSTKASTPTNKPGYTLATLPSNIQGTWYSYDWGKLETLTITNNKIIDNGHVATIHTKPKNKDTSKDKKHSQWEYAIPYPKKVRGISMIEVRGWTQTAGDGESYGTINTNGMTVLNSAGGAGVNTDANFFKSKQQAKQNKKKQFHGEKRYPDLN